MGTVVGAGVGVSTVGVVPLVLVVPLVAAITAEEAGLAAYTEGNLKS